MATLLTKPIRRETLAVTDMAGRKQIISLEPGDMLTFRSKGKRMTYEVPIAACYNLALIFTVNSWYRNKMKVWKEKKKMGVRCRKPKRISSVFNQKYYEALRIK